MSLKPVSEYKCLDNNVRKTYGISLDFSFSYFIFMIQNCLKGSKPEMKILSVLRIVTHKTKYLIYLATEGLFQPHSMFQMFLKVSDNCT